MGRGRALLVAVVLGAVAATGGAVVREAGSPEPSAVREAAQERGRTGEIVSDRIDDAVAGLQDAHLWIAPELAGELPEADQAAVEQALAAAPVPTYIVFWTATTEAGYGNTQYGAMDAMLVRLGSTERPARLALVTEDRRMLLQSIGERPVYVDGQLLGGRIGPGFQRFAEAVAAEESEPPYERDTSEYDEFNLVGGDYFGGLVGGSILGALLAGLVLLGLVVLVTIAAWRIRAARPLEDE